MIPDDPELLYNRDSSALMEELCRMQMPVFLDSSLGDGEAKRDVLTAAPVAYISLSEGVADPAGCIPASDAGGLMRKIKELRNEYLVDNEVVEGMPGSSYRGGIHGFLGYPRLSKHGSGRAELMYTDCFVGVYLWNIVVDHRAQSSKILFHNNCSQEFRERLLKAIGRFLKSGVAELDIEKESRNDAQLSELVLKSPFVPAVSRSEYGSAFGKIKDYIDAGDCYQVNLTQGFSATCQGDPFTAYQRLRSATKTPFSAYMQWNGGALLSLSPERFLRLSGNRVRTQPIKGTRPRSSDATKDKQQAKDLLASEKDRAENLMIVDLLRNDLGRVCNTGSVTANQLFSLESFSNVHHLVSSIEGELRGECDAFDLLQACFPGGSITGAPKQRAMEIIEELEPMTRRAYCGSVLRIDSNGDMDSSIIIRSLQWQRQDNADDRLLCWAGGGIVADSEEAAEYQECFDKIDSIFKVLQV
ncbi:MAG: aminodeoxychorismate synthase component I [Gammaproteobacteria bacterium]|nr:aminodeoxychorismate synthase component I [Gammaproteobacteria bacterium]MBT3858807.1 aminodeoxychorismate synthase component I [Gammaproteobacteria bacterium]MBT3986158.1 aminodeoxychorismate synthase component I [Gammaproteobacteria bacterium]MBT4254570.1 aminodeoxychorismate synthase component I [Gammaproteobacteria bacterium]MBT4580936.1 aminodeoxychorismate synthase component I [Gammaproteobacteria bacterium]